MDQPEELTNQTQFGEEEPVFENPTLPEAPVMKSDAVPPTSKKIWQQKSFQLVGGGVIVFLFLLTTIIASQPRQRIRQILQNTTQASPLPQASAFETRVQKVKADLQNADPTKVDLPFPPIERNIFIDQPAQ